jgi:hypothetical protein
MYVFYDVFYSEHSLKQKNVNLVAQLMKARLQNQNFTIFKIALNRVLTLPDYRYRLALSISSGIIDFGNENISVVAKHWNYRISVPMLYIAVIYEEVVKT